MASSTDSACYFQQLPDLALEPLFEFMAPHDLLHLSMISRKMFILIQYMRTKATFDFTFAPNKTTIHVKTSRNVQSEIVVGQVEEDGEKFDCCFDRESFFQYQKMQNGVVYPHGLGTVLNRLLCIYPRVVIDNMNIALSGAPSVDYEPLFEVLTMVESKKLSIKNIRFEMENGRYTVHTFLSLYLIFAFYGSRVKLPDLLTVEDGCDFPYAVFLNMGLRSLRVNNSRMTDYNFNMIVRAWNASSNTQLRELIIGTSEAPSDANGEYLLTGLSRINGPLYYPEEGINEDSNTVTIQRHSDQETAYVVRKEDEFAFYI